MSNREKNINSYIKTFLYGLVAVLLLVCVVLVIEKIGTSEDAKNIFSIEGKVMAKELNEDTVESGKHSKNEYVCTIQIKDVMLQYRSKEQLNAKSLCDALLKDETYLFSFKNSEGNKVIVDYYKELE
ncbi:hypothetical protein U8V72_25605 [Priestia filamentosa]|uniref:hypothetical protein n=1 Tax=Priestia filamentosa TaxID=1402861 RepID=UPI00397AF695